MPKSWVGGGGMNCFIGGTVYVNSTPTNRLTNFDQDFVRSAIFWIQMALHKKSKAAASSTLPRGPERALPVTPWPSID